MHPAVRESTDNLYCSLVKNEWKENAAAGCFSSECCKFNLHLRSNIKSCLKSLIGQGFWGEGAAFLWILNCLFHQETSLCLDSSCQSMDLAWKEQLWSAKCDKKGGRRSCYSNCGKCDGCLLSVSHLHHHLLWQRTTPQTAADSYICSPIDCVHLRKRESATKLNLSRPFLATKVLNYCWQQF